MNILFKYLVLISDSVKNSYAMLKAVSIYGHMQNWSFLQ